jgi:hypothetical protein
MARQKRLRPLSTYLRPLREQPGAAKSNHDVISMFVQLASKNAGIKIRRIKLDRE